MCVSLPGGILCVYGVFNGPFAGQALRLGLWVYNYREYCVFFPPGPLSPLNLGPCLKAKYQLQCCRALQKICIQATNLPQSFEIYGFSKDSTFFLYQEPELIQ